MGLVIGPPLFLMCWVGLALQTKRFHDRGRSGLWTMLPMLPAMMITTTIVTSLAGGQTPEQAIASVGMWMLITQAVNIFMLVDEAACPAKRAPTNMGRHRETAAALPRAVRFQTRQAKQESQFLAWA